MYRKTQLTDLLSLFNPFFPLGTGKDKMLSVELHEYVYAQCSCDACHTFQTSHDKRLFITV